MVGDDVDAPGPLPVEATMVEEEEVDYPKEDARTIVGVYYYWNYLLLFIFIVPTLEIEFGKHYAIFPLGTCSGHIWCAPD